MATSAMQYYKRKSKDRSTNAIETQFANKPRAPIQYKNAILPV